MNDYSDDDCSVVIVVGATAADNTAYADNEEEIRKSK
jgi:hypothetical protein